MNATVTDTLAHVRTIYEAAREVSHEARAELAGDLQHFRHDNPAKRWNELVTARAERGIPERVKAAGRQVEREAGAGPNGRAVRLAVKNLVQAVADLTGFVPEYDDFETYEPHLGEFLTCYTPTEAAAVELDRLRQTVFVRLVELDELLRGHPNPLAQLCTVAKRIAVKLLPTAEAVRVGRWFERLESDSR